MRDADLRRRVEGEHGVFVVEGSRALRQLLDGSRWPVVSLLLRPERAAVLADLVDAAERRGAPVYVAGSDTFDRIAGFRVHRGVLALAGRQPDPDPEPVGLLGGVDVAVIVEGVNDHENMGAIFRNAAALGAGAVLLDPSCCDPLYRRAVRVSVGHVLRVPFARLRPWPQALEDVVAGAGFSVVALDPAAPETIETLPYQPRVAVLVGAEGSGLSAAARAAATHRARIRMAAGVDSLNVATSVAIALHRLVPYPGSGRGPARV